MIDSQHQPTSISLQPPICFTFESRDPCQSSVISCHLEPFGLKRCVHVLTRNTYITRYLLEVSLRHLLKLNESTKGICLNHFLTPNWSARDIPQPHINIPVTSKNKPNKRIEHLTSLLEDAVVSTTAFQYQYFVSATESLTGVSRDPYQVHTRSTS